ncbi:hypothetical protein CHISP_1350 [Chitinispirillum alkaliphilum]|nr:hypothetical protein CHISP_1350 [Chitinispirillum alkaliphilum]
MAILNFKTYKDRGVCKDELGGAGVNCPRREEREREREIGGGIVGYKH